MYAKGVQCTQCSNYTVRLKKKDITIMFVNSRTCLTLGGAVLIARCCLVRLGLAFVSERALSDFNIIRVDSEQWLVPSDYIKGRG